MKNKIFNILSVSLLAIGLNSCAPALIVGGAGIVGYTAAQERSVGDAIDDVAIEAEVNTLLISSDQKGLFMDVDVDAVEGKVLLTGTVPDRKSRLEAYKLAWKPSGVKEVINEIRLAKDRKFSPSRLASDSWITTQIESQMLFTKDIASVNFSVETIDGVVYLMGVARTKEELEKVAAISSKTKNVERVVSHVRIKGIEQTVDASPVSKKKSEPIVEEYKDAAPGEYAPPAEVEEEEIEGISKP